jgi:glycosyltransferase involved in cell wall biosynthesis
MREYPIGMAGTRRVQNFLDYLQLYDILINVISFRGHLKQPESKGVYKSIPFLNIGQGVEMKISHLHRIIAYYIKGSIVICRMRKRGYSNIIYNSGGISIENFLFILLSKILGFRLVLAIEEDYSYFNDDIKLISRFKFWTINRFDFLNCRWADSIVVISNYLKNKYVNLGAKNVTLIPITAKLNNNPAKKSFSENLQVIYAGTFTDKDGVGEIIEGFLKFNSLYRNALLILTGKSAQQLLYKDKYKERENIIFKGFVEDDEFYDLLRNSDVMCMCRTDSGFANAGFPFKLGEYLATGNPVICTRVSDVEYYLTDEDVYLIDRADPVLISEALIKIYNDQQSALEKGQNGLKKCRKYFSPDTNGEKLVALLESISDKAHNHQVSLAEFI